MPGQSKSKFYVDSESSPGHVELALPSLEPVLLSGEIIASTAEKVLKLHAYSSEKKGETGNLYVTNFRICFVTPQAQDSEGSCESRHKFIGENDILLSKITAIYQISGDKSKKLSPGSKGSSKALQIHTKDLGIYDFSFRFTEKQKRNNLVTAILHHAFPKRHSLLFIYEPRSASESISSNGDNDIECVNMRYPSAGEDHGCVELWRPKNYDTKLDWDGELARLNANSRWRVTEVNNSYYVSHTMPDCFPVPNDADDPLLKKSAPQFTSYRLPVWCYTHHNGYSLVSTAALTPETVHIQLEKRLIEAIKTSQPGGTSSPEPFEIDLNKQIAENNALEIQTSFMKMFTICAPATVEEFYNSDNSVHSQLDSSHWLRTVISCLGIANEISERLERGKSSVYIREDTGADITCVVSCLVQILLDSTCRTIKGLQNIIQRCWVSLGHPFCDRLSITSDQPISPVILLFLDCVYQLTVQFPSMFEFSEIYLISLWDSCTSGMFREFVYNCNKERKPVLDQWGSDRNGSPTAAFPSVWSWDLQYTAEYISLFRNPLYELNKTPDHHVDNPSTSSTIHPNIHPSQIEVWVGCFYRNTAPMQITNGGKPAEYFQQCIIMEEIIAMQNQMSKLKSGSMSRRSGLFFNTSQTTSDDNGMRSKLKSSFITSTFPFNNRIRRNVSDISLCTLIERSLVFSDQDHGADGDDP